METYPVIDSVTPLPPLPVREMTGEEFKLTEEWKERFFKIHEPLSTADLKTLETHIIENFSFGTVILPSLVEENSKKFMGPWELACLGQAVHSLCLIKSIIDDSVKQNPLPSK